MNEFSPNIISAHAQTVVPQLPKCTACGERITFYMHQDYHRDEKRMHYFHPECCPTCTRDREASS